MALIASLLLLLLCIKVFLWFAERFVTRQRNYESTRAPAATTAVGQKWTEPPRLELFEGQ